MLQVNADRGQLKEQGHRSPPPDEALILNPEYLFILLLRFYLQLGACEVPPEAQPQKPTGSCLLQGNGYVRYL
jgi:hypothetical protein